MDDSIDGSRALPCFQSFEAEMHRQRIEGFAAIRQVRDQRVYTRAIQRHQIDIQDLMALAHQIRDDMAPRLAAAAGEYDPLTHQPAPPMPLLAAHLTASTGHHSPRSPGL